MTSVEKHEVVAAAAIKFLKELVSAYKGPEGKLREYLLRELGKRDSKADAILARLIDEILDSAAG